MQSFFHERPSPIRPVLQVFCIDFDGCSDSEEARQQIINTVILPAIRANIAISSVMICIGSLRQTVVLDIFNAKKHLQSKHRGHLVSCSVLGKEFITQLQEAISLTLPTRFINVMFNNLLMHDVLNELPSGTTFEQMNNDLYKRLGSMKEKTEIFGINIHGEKVTLLKIDPSIRKVSQGSSIFVSDKSKLLMMYMFIQNISLRYQSTHNIYFQLVDDHSEMLLDMERFFIENPECLPHGCHFQGIDFFYDDQTHKTEIDVTSLISGIGVCNPLFIDDLRSIALDLATITSISKSPTPSDVSERLIRTINASHQSIHKTAASL